MMGYGYRVPVRVWRCWKRRLIKMHPSESWWYRLASVAMVLRMPKMPKQIWRASPVEVEGSDIVGWGGFE
jgi:hypothetical protein